ncbi:ketosamine-3-kinase, putative [Ixodes scapularis]|uniref:protein-ribulosamine 3-kinase n=1 Tax=Ixodes scapularis TaxID=6945 RepID=B7PPL8_IXOSC|nr:ketosamine-3-kinase, putative [Ixodes scapularis]|eukprot:XP_002435710.1 ketosamine-3-kinase, putative [Ixodes scapularis]
MDALLKEALGTTKLRATGRGGSGCINQGECFETDSGYVFIKRNSKDRARQMFDGEFAALTEILKTNTVRVPTPIAIVDNPEGGAALAMEYVEMRHLSKHSAQLGEQLASMHLHNERVRERSHGGSVHNQQEDFVEQFGFHTTTCCGYLPLDNSWNGDWVEFFCRQRIDHQIRVAQEKYRDREAAELWTQLVHKVPGLFQDIDVAPSLVHGDLWGGNVAEHAGGPIIYDPAAFYGHAEFDLSIAKLFGGFDAAFYSAYFKVIPKAPGFEKRLDLYQLFHYLNHWNHFGGGYRSSSISTMKRLLRSCS